jgi:hypothetical protein
MMNSTKKVRDLVVLIGPLAFLALVNACGPKAEKRLQPSGKVLVPAVARFVAAEHFVSPAFESDHQDGPLERGDGVWLATMNEEFKRFFLNKTEEKVSSTTLSIWKVALIGKSPLVLAELGDKAETELAHLWALLEMQPHGPLGNQGVLFCSSESMIADPNIFFIRGTDGNLKQISVRWAALDRYDPWQMGWGLTADPAQGCIIDNDYLIFSH